MKKLFVILAMVVAFSTSMLAQTQVRGTVYDKSNGEPLIGATVHAKGTTVATATDVDGNFTLTVPSGAKTLLFSYVGMKSLELPVKSNMTVEMEPTSDSLDEVIVVAYGQQKKSSVTGSISQVNSDQLQKRPVSSIASALEGSMPGIQVTGSYGAAGSSPTIRIRGVGTVNGSSSPLYVVDGVPYDGNMTDFNPEDIESMSVLKDAASAALYGNRAANGVILITTKKAKDNNLHITFKTNQGWFSRGIPEYDILSADQWMTAMFTAVKNYQYVSNLGKGQDHATALSNAITYAQANTVEDMAKLNIYNVASDNLFQSNGSLNPQARILSGYADDLDWFDQAIRKGYRAEYNLTGTGASSNSDYMFSLGYLNENGYVINNDYSRLSARANVNIRPVSWLRSGLNVNTTYQKYNNAKGEGDDSGSYTNAFMYCRNIAPIYPVHLHYTDDGITDPSKNGQYILDGAGNKQWDPGFYNTYTSDGLLTQIQTRNQYSGRHMIWENQVNSDASKRVTVQGIAYADIILPYGFTATVRGLLSLRNNRASGYDSSEIGDGSSANGRFRVTNYHYRSYTFQEQLRWQQTYGGKHNINVLLAHENYDYNYIYQYDFKSNEIAPGGQYLSNFTELNTISGYKNEYKTESYLARVQYNFDERYNVEASYRRDGSSRFAPGKRWGNFGSVGANWVFSNEEFLKDWTWLNMGKLRADWGQVGQDAGLGYYAYMSALAATGKYGGEGAWYLTQRPAYDITWETAESWGIGLETRLFNRWNLSIEYYDKRNKDLLFSVNDPASAGSVNTSSSSATHSENFGTIANRGIEIDTDVDVFANKDWTINIAANLTTLKNKILKLPEAYQENGYRSGSYLLKEGTSRYEWNTYTYCGVDMTNGDALYKPNYDSYYIDDNGTIIGDNTKALLAAENWTKINGQYYVYNATSYGERVYKGTALPKVYGSFTGNFRWKNLTLSAMFTYSLGGKVMESNYSGLMSFSGNATQLHQDVLNSWVPEMRVDANDPNRIRTDINPQLNQTKYSTNNATSDRFLISRNYLIFKNLNVAYTFPRKLLQKAKLSNVTLSFSAENLFTKTNKKGMDAMQSIGGAQSAYLVTARVFTFGLTVGI